jgi:hypothetical protein
LDLSGLALSQFFALGNLAQLVVGLVRETKELLSEFLRSDLRDEHDARNP